MKKSLKIIVLTIVSILGLSSFSLTPTFADNPCNYLNSDSPAYEAAGCNPTANEDALPGVIIGVINAVISLIALVAVVYIIIGGVNYMTSSGDAGKVEKAKKTIIYALIGLVICAIAFVIVNWAIKAIQSA